jgi:hypothetical protein
VGLKPRSVYVLRISAACTAAQTSRREAQLPDNRVGIVEEPTSGVLVRTGTGAEFAKTFNCYKRPARELLDCDPEEGRCRSGICASPEPVKVVALGWLPARRTEPFASRRRTTGCASLFQRRNTASTSGATSGAGIRATHSDAPAASLCKDSGACANSHTLISCPKYSFMSRPSRMLPLKSLSKTDFCYARYMYDCGPPRTVRCFP